MPRLAASRRTTLLLAALVAFGPLSIDMCLPALPAIAADLHATQAQAQHTVGVFLAGFSIGMLFYGPLSDRYGRRPLLLGGMAVYVLASLGCVLSRSIEALLLWRLLQALGGAAASVLGRTIVRDVFPVREAAGVLSLMHLVTMAATLVAPLLGGYLILFASWRAIFGVLLALAALCLLLTARHLPESHARGVRRHSLGAAFAAYLHMLRQPRALGYMLCIGLSFGGMFAFITASPFVYMVHFGISTQAYAWLFALNIGGVMVVTAVNARLVGRVGPQRMLMLASGVAAATGAALILSGAAGIGGLAAIVVCMLGYVGVTGLIGTNSVACLMALFPATAGAAASLAVVCQFGMGMALSVLVSAVQGEGALAMCLVVGCSGIGCLLSALLATRERLRADA